MNHDGDARVDLLFDLGQSTISWEPLHHGLEALDQAGFIPHHLPAVPPQLIAQIDARHIGTVGRELGRGGAWIIVPKAGDEPVFSCGVDATTVPVSSVAPAPESIIQFPRPMFHDIAGVAGYGGTFPSRLAAAYDGRDGYALAGPFVLDGPLAEHRLTLTLAVLFSLRERGFWRALIPNVRAAALPALREFFGPALVQVGASDPRPRPRVVLCASGSGSNLQAVIDTVAAGRLDVELVRVIVNRPGAKALERAAAANIPAELVLWQRPLQSRTDYDEILTHHIATAGPDLVLLLGWMHLLAPLTLQRLPECLNIHPAYLPLNPADDMVDFPDGTRQPALRGAHAVDDALRAELPWIGASVHQVTAAVDRGEILARAPLLCKTGETRLALDQRLHALEHAVLPAALKKWCEDRG